LLNSGQLPDHVSKRKEKGKKGITALTSHWQKEQLPLHQDA
jgi:hypothetical protein